MLCPCICLIQINKKQVFYVNTFWNLIIRFFFFLSFGMFIKNLGLMILLFNRWRLILTLQKRSYWFLVSFFQQTNNDNVKDSHNVFLLHGTNTSLLPRMKLIIIQLFKNFWKSSQISSIRSEILISWQLLV